MGKGIIKFNINAYVFGVFFCQFYEKILIDFIAFTENYNPNIMFYDIIHEATGKKIPPMPGSSRYASEILDSLKAEFSTVKVIIFKNPLVFPSIEPFLAYTRASLSEDRKLWNDFFKTESDFETIMTKIAVVSQKWFERDGKLVMKKVVGGFLAKK